MTESVQRIDSAPVPYCPSYYCWIKIITEIEIRDMATSIELYMAFPYPIPFQLPDIYFVTTEYDPIPHIGYDDRKLCLFEDGTCFSPDDYPMISLECFRKAKKLLTLGANRQNVDEYRTEIVSYWRYSYSSEEPVEQGWLFHGNLPDDTRTIVLLSLQGERPDCHDVTRTIAVSEKEYNCGSSFIDFLRRNYRITEYPALYVSHYSPPPTPPYCTTFNQFLACVSDKKDFIAIRRHLNKHYGGVFLFPLGSIDQFGCVWVSSIPQRAKGWRNGMRSAFDVMCRFERRKLLLYRSMGKVLSAHRIAERTKGELMKEKRLLVAGLGSIGSNLCHFLSGHNNAFFTLIDSDTLSVDNLGRHLLGFNFLGRNKAEAISDHLHGINPDFQVSVVDNDSVEAYIEHNTSRVNHHDAIFICTGDPMSEIFCIQKVVNDVISAPLFILWLEPYAVAGHLLYINPSDAKKLGHLFDEQGVYVHSFIDQQEFHKRPELFTKRDAGCNGSYNQYSGNDVLLFLSAMYPHILSLLDNPSNSTAYRWLGKNDSIKDLGITTITTPQAVWETIQIPI